MRKIDKENISQSSLTATRELLSVFGDDFKPHIHALLPAIIDKMGDIFIILTKKNQLLIL